MINDCEIIKELAEGGQKTVYLAKHPKIGLVVIKRGQIKSFASLERIKREVDFLTGMDSEYFPKQYHFNIDITSKEFEIIEGYIEGSTLRESISAFQTPIQIFNLLNILIEGLSIIWDQNIVHRDLKPENIIIRPNGRPCIIDLGIARFLDMEALTRTISPMGPCTPLYASPEQLVNNKHLIDPRADFFVLGIIALEMYLGVHPFSQEELGNDFSTVENIMKNNYALKTKTVDLDDQMTELAGNILRLQPYERFRNYETFKNFLTAQF